jgi:hypothetical protein
MVKHPNGNTCPECDRIIALYPGFNPLLHSWLKVMKAKYNMLHISEAGRGKEKQNQLFAERTPEGKRKTKAVWGESSHNYNCAIDCFIIIRNVDLYDRHWFQTYFKPEVPAHLNWYGEIGHEFWELAHIEVRNWRDLKERGEIKLVEDLPIQVKLA